MMSRYDHLQKCLDHCVSVQTDLKQSALTIVGVRTGKEQENGEGDVQIRP